MHELKSAKEVLTAAMLSPKRQVRFEQGDYLNEQGLLVCGKCHTPKEFLYTIADQGMINEPFRKNCACEEDAVKAREIEDKRREAIRLTEELRNKGLTDAQYRECTFDKDDHADENASRTCRMFVDKWEEIKAKNIGIMLHGDVGGGKTFMASCIANALLDNGIPVIMTTIKNLSQAITDHFGVDRVNVLKQIASVPLLVLDDVGIEQNTKSAIDTAYDIINERYKAQRPLIVTTNLTMRAIRDEEDTKRRRVYTRLLEMCTPVKVETAGRREAIARAKMEEFMRMMGTDERIGKNGR